MTTPVTQGNFPIFDATQKVYADLNNAALAVKKERQEAFDKQPKWKRVAYYVSGPLAFGGAAIAVLTLPLTLVTWSTSLLLFGVAASIASIIGLIARHRFNTVTVEENRIIKHFSQPQSKESCDFFLPFVKISTQDVNKVRKEEHQKFERLVKFFEGKIDRNELIKKMNAVVVTGLMVDAIQNCVNYEKALVEKKVNTAKKLENVIQKKVDEVEKLWHLPSLDANMKANIGRAAGELKKVRNERSPEVQYYMACLHGERNYQCNVKALDILVDSVDKNPTAAVVTPGSSAPAVAGPGSSAPAAMGSSAPAVAGPGSSAPAAMGSSAPVVATQGSSAPAGAPVTV